VTRSLALALYTSLFFIVLSFTITALASPYIVGDLGGDRYITVYGLAFYGFGSAVTIPLAKPLGARFSIPHLFFFCMFGFSLTAFFCGLAPTYFLFVFGRFLMGVASGPLYGLLSHTFTHLIPEDKKFVASWIFVTVFVVVPVVGAAYGGTVAYLYHWRAPFLATSLITSLLAVALFVFGKEVKIPPLPIGFDWVGWSFWVAGISCIAFALTTAQQLDWYRSPLLVAAAVIGLPCFGYFLVRSYYHDSPSIELRLFRDPVFALSMLCLTLLFAVYFGIIVLLSIWLTFDVEFTPIWIGVLLGTMGIAGLFPRFIIEERFGRVDPLIYLLLATLLLGISCFYTTLFDADINFGRIAISRILAGFGIALFLPPIFKMLSECCDRELWIDGFNILQCLRSLASSLGAACFTIAWQRRSVFYHERLGEKLTRTSVPARTFFQKVETLQVPGDPPSQLNHFLDRRAASLALDDVFYLMGWILAGLFLLLCLILILRPLYKRLVSNSSGYTQK
jgi:MFS transporter, DHA2 family, multidrug resistance protein